MQHPCNLWGIKRHPSINIKGFNECSFATKSLQNARVGELLAQVLNLQFYVVAEALLIVIVNTVLLLFCGPFQFTIQFRVSVCFKACQKLITILLSLFSAFTRIHTPTKKAPPHIGCPKKMGLS